MTHEESLIPPHGGYRSLHSFQLAQPCYDVTVRFCNRYIDRRSRTHDQMVQAARSGVQNIAEGSQVSGTSKKSELKLTNIARGSLEELRRDYDDFLRHRGLALWPVDDIRRRQLVARRCKTADAVADWISEQYEMCKQNIELYDSDGPNRHDGRNGRTVKRSTESHASITSIKSIQSINSEGEKLRPTASYPEIAANAALVLIGVACTMLDRQLQAQARSFTNEGGFTERLYRTRKSSRRNQRY